MPIIDAVPALGDAAVPQSIAIAAAIALVVGALARLVKASQPWLIERERTRRAACVEREKTLRTAGVTVAADGAFSRRGPAAVADPSGTSVVSPHAAGEGPGDRR